MKPRIDPRPEEGHGRRCEAPFLRTTLVTGELLPARTRIVATYLAGSAVPRARRVRRRHIEVARSPDRDRGVPASQVWDLHIPFEHVYPFKTGLRAASSVLRLRFWHHPAAPCVRGVGLPSQPLLVEHQSDRLVRFSDPVLDGGGAPALLGPVYGQAVVWGIVSQRVTNSVRIT
jgi:hypothetical protein